MLYKRLGHADLSALQQIGRLTYEPYYQHVWHPGGVEWYIHHCFNTERLTAELNDPHCEYYIAMTDTEEWVGLLKLVPYKPVPNENAPDPLYVPAQKVENTEKIAQPLQNLPLSLEKIYLMPNFFQKGMGQVLMQFSLERAWQLGCPAVWLNVLKTGPVSVYEKTGFSIVGTQRIPFDLIKDEYREMWVMVLDKAS